MKTPMRSMWSVSLAVALVAGAAAAGHAGHGARAVAGGPANVQVWIDGGDVFPGYGDVTIWVRADRDCYSTLFLVDTAGYIHVLSPNGYEQDGWLTGGRSYCYRACDLGLDRLDGYGISYVFAVGSPVPFDYSYYGAGVFVGAFGFRVSGDPFVACREFYTSMLPAGCRWEHVGVGYTRFYVREWVRYPAYLCAGGPGFHVRVGGACRLCADVYASYRCNSAAPWDAIRPVPRDREMYRAYGARPAIQRTGDARPVAPRAMDVARPSRGAIDPSGSTARAMKSQAGVRERVVERERVVSTSRGAERGARDVARNASQAWKSSARSGNAGRPETFAMAPRGSRNTERAPAVAGAPEKGARKKSRQAH